MTTLLAVTFVDNFFMTLSLPLLIAGLGMLPIILFKMWLAINHPEKYRRYKEWEEEETQLQRKRIRAAAAAGIKIVRRINKMRK